MFKLKICPGLRQVDTDTENLRSEKRRLEDRVKQRDFMLLEQHNRIVQLESVVASVKEERNGFVQSLDNDSTEGIGGGARAQRDSRFANARKRDAKEGGPLSSWRQVRR